MHTCSLVLVNPFTKQLYGCKALLHTLVKYGFVEFLLCLLFFVSLFFFSFATNHPTKMQYNAISVSAEKVTAPIPIPKFGISFGSRYRYRISVGHYFGVKTSSKKPTKFLPYFCPNLSKEARAEIGQKFRWFFGRSFDTKRTFWN